MSQSDDKKYEMTPHRKVYLDHLEDRVKMEVGARFIKGQKGHGGDIDRKACYPHLREELIDAIVYFYEHQNRLVKWEALLRRALEGKSSKEYALDKVASEIALELGEATTAEVFHD